MRCECRASDQFGGQDINLRAVAHTGRAAAATLNGKTWTIAKLPALRTGRASLFDAVSCPSASYCVAVGHSRCYPQR